MKAFHHKWILLGLLSIAQVGCALFEVPGCMDPTSLTYNYEANVDDGTCRYSDVTFFSRYLFYGGVAIASIEVTVDGESIGFIGGYYPNGPQGCFAPGTLKYTFRDGIPIDWGAKIYLMNGQLMFASGRLSPTNFDDCIPVNVAQ